LKVLFIVNPRSGIRRRGNAAATIARNCPWEHSIAEAERKEDLDRIIADGVANGCDLICAVGGDGTVHEVARRLIGTELVLGVIPLGSGNGFARHIGLPMRIEHSLRSCLRGHSVTIDTGSVNGHPFLGTMGAGFDAWVAAEFAARGTRGFRTYVRTALGGFFSYRAERYEIEIDGTRTERRAMLVVVANASQYGNNARIAPRASLQDGLLDVVAVERRSLMAAARLFHGSIDRAAGVSVERGRHIEIRRAAAGPAHVDGEPVQLAATLVVDVVPQSLHVLVPERVRAV